MANNQIIDLHTGELSERFLDAPLWYSRAVVEARQVKETEHLDTILDNGFLESTCEVPAGHWIVTNPGGNDYAMSNEEFQERFEPIGEGKFQEKGAIRAYSNPTGKSVEVVGLNGEKQVGDRLCYFVCAIGENFEPTNERYIISLDEFEATYKWAEALNILVPLKNLLERQATLAGEEG